MGAALVSRFVVEVLQFGSFVGILLQEGFEMEFAAGSI